MNIRVTRGRVLVKRHEWARKHDSDVLDLAIPDEYVAQTWCGEVIAVGPAAYLEREVSDGMEGGIPRRRRRVRTDADGRPLTVGQELRKGDIVHFQHGGTVEILIESERYVFVPTEAILYAERNESAAA